jgi:alkaline phosphatase
MIRHLIAAVLIILSPLASAQIIFAHNDYLKPSPFFKAFELKAAYIEADVFLEEGKLLVAHTKREIDPSKTLEIMYLQPLSQKVKENNGKLYGLTLMIDLKTAGVPTMAVLIKSLEKFPELQSCKGLLITMSGEYPPANEWNNYPSYITFDGRPNVDYTAEQVKKINLVSTSFVSVSQWDGKGEIPEKDAAKIKQAVDWAHKLNKPMRFWASPDMPNAWQKFIDMHIDILNSDNIEELSKFLSR